MTLVEKVAVTFAVGVVFNIAAPTIRALGGSEAAANRVEGFARIYNAAVSVYFAPHPLVLAVMSDEAGAGLRQIISGKRELTLVASGATALHASPFVAELISTGTQMAVSFPVLLSKANQLAASIRAVALESELAEFAADGPIRLHHAYPKYLGGHPDQLLEGLPKNLHDEFHSGLDKLLPRQAGSAYYEALDEVARAQMLHDLADYTKAFDSRHGTKLYEAMVREGFPY